MRMGGASAPPLCFLLLLNKKTFYKMGHFDELLATKVEAGSTKAGALNQYKEKISLLTDAAAAGATPRDRASATAPAWASLIEKMQK